MGKFKVGDRVRWLRVSDRFQNATVMATDEPGSWKYKIRQDNGEYTYASELELVLVVAANATFNVGDRVRYVNRKFGEATVIAITPLGIKVDAGSEYGICTEKPSSLELVDWDHDPRKAAKTEPLKIEAGKFYKTRDGRKVGPMQDCGSFWRINGDGEGNPGHYTADGISAFEGRLPREDRRAVYDLVAEWTSSCAAAQVDNLRDEYGPVTAPAAKASNDNGKPKFKAGDRVVFNTGKGSKHDGKVGTLRHDWLRGREDYFEFRSDDGTSRVTAHINNFNRPTTPAIVCLIEDGQPKPSTYPHVHPSRGHAGDEAARLARKHPGQEFGVYELVDTRQVAKPVYQHEWQRLAVCRQTPPWRRDGMAAELLMKMSGVDSETAFSAVRAFRKAA